MAYKCNYNTVHIILSLLYKDVKIQILLNVWFLHRKNVRNTEKFKLIFYMEIWLNKFELQKPECKLFENIKNHYLRNENEAEILKKSHRKIFCTTRAEENHKSFKNL